ncbi:uncharacterized protein LOC118279581 [Spodoptera frugiperda]|uniref:Uncharacterized protein LOC118279581 n=1 Tax=Spodoptera frugiperda TaxID=7108 RepID=A0A9R0E376_SPOFR|nr:uncharacterized protein LOC118279581 [Spodoptera frugiperda]
MTLPFHLCEAYTTFNFFFFFKRCIPGSGSECISGGFNEATPYAASDTETDLLLISTPSFVPTEDPKGSDEDDDGITPHVDDRYNRMPQTPKKRDPRYADDEYSDTMRMVLQQILDISRGAPVTENNDVMVLFGGGGDEVDLPECSGYQIWWKPDPKDCSSYYFCILSSVKHLKCPEGFHFSSNAICIPQSLSSCQVSEELVEPEESCNEMDGFKSDPTDCRNYYSCEFGSLIQKQCPEDFLFDSREKMCRPDYLAYCEEPEPTAVSTAPPTDAMPPCGAEDYWSRPDIRDCGSSYMCVYGEVIKVRCPDGTAYSQETELYHKENSTTWHQYCTIKHK